MLRTHICATSGCNCHAPIYMKLWCAGDSQADFADELPWLPCKDPPGWLSGNHWRRCHHSGFDIFFSKCVRWHYQSVSQSNTYFVVSPKVDSWPT